MTKLGIIFFFIFLDSNFAFCKVAQKTFARQCREATEIFTGQVSKITIVSEGNYKRYKVKFLTTKIWKGRIMDTVTCAVNEGFCTYINFQLDKNYLVYSENDTIQASSGRSCELGYYWAESDIFKLNVRYLFRRPHKKDNVKNLQTINNAYLDFAILTKEKFYAILDRKLNLQNYLL
jgi:hypothetical protein